MSSTDIKYNALVNEILENGWIPPEKYTRAKYEDGTIATAKQSTNYQLKFNSATEVPLLTTKRVARIDPYRELRWIWQKMSNKVQDLRDMGCNVWNQWELEDGTIGKSYGWQLRNKYQKIVLDELFFDMLDNNEFQFSRNVDDDLRKKSREKLIGYDFELNQVDYLLYMLKKNPYSRQIKTTLWCVEDLPKMALPPCVYETHWYMHKDKLNLTVNIRSNDVAIGNPYNIYQYYLLHRMIAQVSNLDVGELCFNIDIPHIYVAHIDKIKEQVNREQFEQPTVWINPEIKSFYDFGDNDIKVENYKHGESIKFEVAV